jgi:hypothetical protein
MKFAPEALRLNGPRMPVTAPTSTAPAIAAASANTVAAVPASGVFTPNSVLP